MTEAVDTLPSPPSLPSLSPEQVRVLGCLVEKSYTTPDYYPMTLNALVNACNQKSSRDPVVAYQETTVQKALDRLRESGWAVLVRTAGGRTPKYKHNIRKQFQLTDREVAVLTVLMLRGPQTLGELRSRTERMVSFHDLGEVEATVQELAGGYPVSLVVELPREPGRKDHRFMHRLGGDELPAAPPPSPDESAPAAAGDSFPPRDDLQDRVARLEAGLEELRTEFRDLRDARGPNP